MSVLHLGRKTRAWRAVLNVRRSRLSREIAAFAAFAAASVAAAAWSDAGGSALTWLAAGLGLVALFAVDRVYDPVRPPRERHWHSADALLTGPTVAALLAGWGTAFVTLAVVKGALYVRSGLGLPTDRRSRERDGVGRGPGWATVRLGIGLLVPAFAFGATSGARVGGEPWVVPVAWGLAALLVGELVDRARFYEELEPPVLGRPAGASAASPASVAGPAIRSTGAGPPRR